jgi:hypothetical protein
MTLDQSQVKAAQQSFYQASMAYSEKQELEIGEGLVVPQPSRAESLLTSQAQTLSHEPELTSPDLKRTALPAVFERLTKQPHRTVGRRFILKPNRT